MAVTTLLKQAMQIPPTSNFQQIGDVDISKFSQIRVFADNDIKENHVLIHLVMLDGEWMLALDTLLIRGAVQVTNTYDAPGITLRIEAAVTGAAPSTIHLLVYGVPPN